MHVKAHQGDAVSKRQHGKFYKTDDLVSLSNNLHKKKIKKKEEEGKEEEGETGREKGREKKSHPQNL